MYINLKGAIMNKQKTIKSIIISISLAFILALGIIGLPIKAIGETIAAYTPESVELINGDFSDTTGSTTVEGKDVILPPGWTKATDAEYLDEVSVSITDDEMKSLQMVTTSSTASFGMKQIQTSTYLKDGYYRITLDITTEGTTKASAYLTGVKTYQLFTSPISTSGTKQTHNIYFEASDIEDEYLNLELWLGSKSSTAESAGFVKFDNISIYKVSATEYMANYGVAGCSHLSARTNITPRGLDANTLFKGEHTPINTTADWSWYIKETDNASDLTLTLVKENEALVEYSNKYDGNIAPVLKTTTYQIYEDINDDPNENTYRTTMYIYSGKLYFDYENESYVHEVPFALITRYYDDGDQELTLKDDNNYYYSNDTQYIGNVTTKYFINVNGTEMSLTLLAANKYYITSTPLTVYTYDDSTFYLTRTPSIVTFPFDNYILKLKNSNTEKSLTAVSPNFTVEQFGYYRLSVYAKTNAYINDITSSMSINLVANQRTGSHPSGTEKEISLYANPYATTLDITNNWVEYTFYIKGSPISSNNEVSLRFSVDANSTIYVSNISLTRINYEGLTDQTTILDLSTDKDGNSMLASDTITNGNLNSYSSVDYDDDGHTKYPITPSSFTPIGTLNGLNSVAGIIPTNALYVNAKTLIGNVENPGSNNLNVLAIYASSNENYGYRTNNFSLSSNSYYSISFDVYTDATFTGTVYSKLYFDDILVSNLADITSTGAWTTYTYFVKISSSAQSASLEFGIANAANTCFFRNLSYKSINENLFTEKSQKTVDDTTYPMPFSEQKANHYICIDSSVENFAFITYNYTDDTNKLYSSYTYTTATESTGIAGVIDTNDSLVGTVFENITKLNLPDSTTNHVLALYNANDSQFVKISQVFGKTLSASTYYKISIWIKTKDIEADKGLDITVKETGKNDEDEPLTIHFEKINTANYTNNDTNDYKEYTAYIKTGVTAPNSITMEIAFGNNETSSTGYAFIGKIAYQDSNKKEYKNAHKANNLHNGDAQFVDLSSTTTQTSTSSEKENKTDAVMIFFVVFSSLALVGSLILTIVMLFIKKLPKSKKKVKTKKIETSDGERQKGGFV